jgi:spore maturation protein CgeB
MRVLIADYYYTPFLRDFYTRRPELRHARYAEQWRAMMDECHGTADFYSRNLRALGHDGAEVVLNYAPLQVTWASEHHSVAGSLLRPFRNRATFPPVVRALSDRILLEQAAAFRADAVHFQAPELLTADTARRLRKVVPILTGQIASPFSGTGQFRIFDIIFSSLRNFVEAFRAEGLRSEVLHLGFEPTVLERLVPDAPREGVIFVGGVSAAHAERIRFLEAIATALPLRWWGYGVESLPAHSRLRRAYQGPAWGLDMYRRLAAAKICVNRHIDVAGDFANNMRLYETTGVGTMLLTDAKQNLGELFAPGQEVIAWRSVEECIALAGQYLADDAARTAIAEAGQRRTLASHTYQQRMEQYVRTVSSL